MFLVFNSQPCRPGRQEAAAQSMTLLSPTPRLLRGALRYIAPRPASRIPPFEWPASIVFAFVVVHIQMMMWLSVATWPVQWSRHSHIYWRRDVCPPPRRQSLASTVGIWRSWRRLVSIGVISSPHLHPTLSEGGRDRQATDFIASCLRHSRSPLCRHFSWSTPRSRIYYRPTRCWFTCMVYRTDTWECQPWDTGRLQLLQHEWSSPPPRDYI